MYSAPMVMVPHSNTGQTHFVQHNSSTLNRNVIQDADTVQTTPATLVNGSVPPPDTTTHSPKSPGTSSNQTENSNDNNMASL